MTTNSRRSWRLLRSSSWILSILAACTTVSWDGSDQLLVRADVAPAADAPQPWPLDEALAAIKVKDDFVVELAAAEPLVADPVAIDFGPDGRLWVADMTDYTRDVDHQEEQTGTVRVLTDRDGDGRYDESTNFVEKLRFPTDVKAWGAGVIVCDAPDVLYFEDTDGDNKADVRKILLTGFATHNPQARVNSLRWGLDNWLYGSGGLFGGKITTWTGKKFDLGGRDFRFRPETGEIEPLTGKTQQGLARDDWGNWFGCENESILDHYPLVDRYLARNQHIAPPAAEPYVPEGGDDANRLFPIGTPTLYALSGPPGRPTSICGLEFYRDELLGAEYANNAFIAEPVNELVHRRIVVPRGATFGGLRGQDEQDREFLASTEAWFRPVQIRTGLDGCLYVVDMHRAVIEDPVFIPEETKRGLDMFAGRDEGRILRIRRKDAPRRTPLVLSNLTPEELVAALDSPNGPQRDLAQQLLVARSAVDVAPLLRMMAREAARPATRLQALCTLDGLKRLDANLLLAAIDDPHPGVRRHAIRLSEQFAASSPPLASAILNRVNDDDPQVRLQVAYTLGELRDSRVAPALVQLAWQHVDDPYVLSAVWSSVSNANASGVVRGLFDHATDAPLSEALFAPAIKLSLALGEPDDVRHIAAQISKQHSGPLSPWRLDAAAELLEEAAHRPPAALPDKAELVDQLAPPVAAARVLIASDAGDAHSMISALRLLFAIDPGRQELVPRLAERLAPQNPPEVQLAVVELIGSIKTRQAGAALLDPWRGYSPEVRGRAFDVLIGSNELTRLLLETVIAGDLAARDFDALQRQRLLEHSDPAIRKQARVALASAIDADRDRIVRDYVAADVVGDLARGRQVFRKTCTSCHRVEGEGHSVGPDLAAVTTRTRAGLTESILDPNRAIDERYRSYSAYTVDGLAHAGILVAETTTSVTLVEQEGKSLTLLRPDIETFQAGKSLMPEGFERDLSPQDVADVTAYLIGIGAAPKNPETKSRTSGR